MNTSMSSATRLLAPLLALLAFTGCTATSPQPAAPVPASTPAANTALGLLSEAARVSAQQMEDTGVVETTLVDAVGGDARDRAALTYVYDPMSPWETKAASYDNTTGAIQPLFDRVMFTAYHLRSILDSGQKGVRADKNADNTITLEVPGEGTYVFHLDVNRTIVRVTTTGGGVGSTDTTLTYQINDNWRRVLTKAATTVITASS